MAKLNRTNLDNLMIKNAKYANFYERIKHKLKNVRYNERTDTLKLMEENIDRKINSISRQDVDFYRESSRKIILEMIKQAKTMETQLSSKLIELIEDHKKQTVIEKENAEVNYSLITLKKGRKRKLPLQQII